MPLHDDTWATLDRITSRRSPASSLPADELSSARVDPSRAPAGIPELVTDVSRYEVRSLLGAGGMGEVHFCRDSRIGRDVAMKVVRPPYRRDATARLRFLREARIQGQLEHPAIVPVYDLGADIEGSAYFTMKCLRGLTLARILKDLRAGRGAAAHGFSRRKLLTAFCSICLAVDFAHTRGVLHRDLKPANIMLGDFGEVYLLDWGVAKLMGAPDLPDDTGPVMQPVDMGEVGAHGGTTPGDVLGTLGYMSPEQARGEMDALDGRSDVYSLGAILFEILALEPLHPKRSRGEMLSSLLAGVDARPSVRAPLRDVPPELDAICVKATRQNPADRYASARALRDDVERYLDGDRDLALRRELSTKHAGLAEESTEKALVGGEGAESARKTALREVGRALALDPANEQALHALRRILTEPPREVPAEVLTEMAMSARERKRGYLRAAVTTELAGIALVPLAALWMGVRDRGMVIATAVLMAVSIAAKFVAARAAALNSVVRWTNVAYVLNLLSILCLSRAFGPLVITPMLLAVYAFANAIEHGTTRHFITITACGAMLAGVAVEIAGILPRMYSFENGAMTLLPRALMLPEIPTITTMTVITMFVISSVVALTTRLQRALHHAEQRAVLQMWQLRQLLPEHAGGAASSVPPARPSARPSAPAPAAQSRE